MNRTALSTITIVLCGVACARPKAEEKPRVPQVTFSDAVFDELVPVAEGGAYAVSGGGGGVWYLKGSEGIRVKEVPTLSPAAAEALAPTPETWLRAKGQHTRHRLRRVGRELREFQDAQDEASEEDYDPRG